ncbi:MAG: hypothetical protein ACI85Q_000806 [Salibacteraceae bacterium]|jgi:hypothetical protein
MKFLVGDKVHLLDEDGEGVITEILNANQVLVDLEGFSFEFDISNILKVNSNNEVVHHRKDLQSDFKLDNLKSDTRKEVLQHIPKKVFQRVSKSGYPEIDLHIYELVDKPQNLSNSEMLQIQNFRLEQFIQDCITSLVSELVVIHGVGEGVLKQEVRSILSSHGNMEFWDADFREYGSGATHVRIRGLFQY